MGIVIALLLRYCPLVFFCRKTPPDGIKMPVKRFGYSPFGHGLKWVPRGYGRGRVGEWLVWS